MSGLLNDLLAGISKDTLRQVAKDLVGQRRFDTLNGVMAAYAEVSKVPLPEVLAEFSGDSLGKAVGGGDVAEIDAMLAAGYVIQSSIKPERHGESLKCPALRTAFSHIAYASRPFPEAAVIRVLDAIPGAHAGLVADGLSYDDTYAKFYGLNEDFGHTEEKRPLSLLALAVKHERKGLRQWCLDHFEATKASPVDLIIACNKGDVAVIQRVLPALGRVSQTVLKSLLPCAAKHPEVLDGLRADQLSTGAARWIFDGSNTPVPEALYERLLPLLKGMDETALLAGAVKADNVPLVRRFLAEGMSPDLACIDKVSESRYGYSAQRYVKPLIFFARSPEMVDLLGRHGADMMVRDNDGLSPIQAWVDMKSSRVVDMARAAVAHGADPTLRTTNGRTLFQLATTQSDEVKRGLRGLVKAYEMGEEINFASLAEEPVPAGSVPRRAAGMAL